MEMTGKIWIEKGEFYKIIRKTIEEEINLGQIPQNAAMEIELSSMIQNVPITFRWVTNDEI